MTPGTGTRLGPYEIVALLGAGGIGEVLSGEGTTARVGIAALLPPCRVVATGPAGKSLVANRLLSLQNRLLSQCAPSLSANVGLFRRWRVGGPSTHCEPQSEHLPIRRYETIAERAALKRRAQD
jgi:hypothetical protein